MALRLTHEVLELETAHPFGIARGTQSSYRVVWVRLTDDDGVEGWGEADPSSYYGETADTVVAALKRLGPLLPEERLDVTSVPDEDDPDVRVFTLAARGETATAFLHRLMEA